MKCSRFLLTSFLTFPTFIEAQSLLHLSGAGGDSLLVGSLNRQLPASWLDNEPTDDLLVSIGLQKKGADPTFASNARSLSISSRFYSGSPGYNQLSYCIGQKLTLLAGVDGVEINCGAGLTTVIPYRNCDLLPLPAGSGEIPELYMTDRSGQRRSLLCQPLLEDVFSAVARLTGSEVEALTFGAYQVTEKNYIVDEENDESALYLRVRAVDEGLDFETPTATFASGERPGLMTGLSGSGNEKTGNSDKGGSSGDEDSSDEDSSDENSDNDDSGDVQVDNAVPTSGTAGTTPDQTVNKDEIAKKGNEALLELLKKFGLNNPLSKEQILTQVRLILGVDESSDDKEDSDEDSTDGRSVFDKLKSVFIDPKDRDDWMASRVQVYGSKRIAELLTLSAGLNKKSDEKIVKGFMKSASEALNNCTFTAQRAERLKELKEQLDKEKEQQSESLGAVGGSGEDVVDGVEKQRVEAIMTILITSFYAVLKGQSED